MMDTVTTLNPVDKAFVLNNYQLGKLVYLNITFGAQKIA
jgi:hypothetical protein